ncbi:unnamed protein product [Meloidogyne enterolobii]|uniref:Uncharacterized protein n=1 Tax=Meloidogyne enterolobii TaxID=390850 RepID=A0ACB0ZJT7_MELEN
MLKQSLFILFFNFCWAIDVKLKIGENYLESRQFDYLKNFQQRIKCFLWYRIGDNEDIISGEFDKNIYLFKDVPKQIYEKEDTEEKEKLKDAEFRCEYEKHSILSEIIPWKKHGARKAELMEKMPEDYFDRKQSLLAEIKKEYTKIIQTGYILL